MELSKTEQRIINKYDNIDYCLNILYDYIYTQSSECYEINYESKINVPLENLKKDINFDYDHILAEKLEFIDRIHDNLIFKRFSTTGYSAMIKMRPYEDDININNLHSRHLIDMKLNYILSDLAINNNHKFLLFPIMNFDVNMDEIKRLNPSAYDQILTSYTDTDNISEGTVCVQVMEHYFKLMTVEQYLQQNYKTMSDTDWKVFCFQILYILYKIQKQYPSFRHNRLDLNAMYVYIRAEKDKEKPRQYRVEDILFSTPGVGFDIKISNFYQSNIDSIADNKDTNLKRDNPYYDIHYICNSLMLFFKKNDIKNYYLYRFLEEIVPEKFRSNNEETIELDEDYYFQNVTTILSPLIILTKNNFFIEFIIKHIQMDSEMSNNPMDLDSLQDSSIEYLMSSSITERGDGKGPSMMAQSRNKKKNNQSVTGKRKLAQNIKKNKRKNQRGGNVARGRQDFNDFGELTEIYDDDSKMGRVEGDETDINLDSDDKDLESEDVENHEEDETKDNKEDEDTGDEDTGDDEDEDKVTNENEEDNENTDDQENDDDEDDEDNEIEFSDEEPKTEQGRQQGSNMLFGMLRRNNDNLKRSDIKDINQSLFKSNRNVTMGRSKNGKGKKSKNNNKSNNNNSNINQDMNGNNQQSQILKQLPENYEGFLPDWLQDLMPPSIGKTMTPGGLASQFTPPFNMPPMPSIPTEMTQQMPQMPQMPQAQGEPDIFDQIFNNQATSGIPQQFQNIPQMQQQMAQVPQQMGQNFQDMANVQFNQQKVQAFNNLATMKNTFSNPAEMVQDHLSLLPSHLLMKNAQAQGAPAPQMNPGARSDDFFFSPMNQNR